MVSIAHRSHHRQRGVGGGWGVGGGRDGWREHRSCGELTRGKEHVEDVPPCLDPTLLLRASVEGWMLHPFPVS